MHDQSSAPFSGTLILYFGVIINSVPVFQDVRNEIKHFASDYNEKNSASHHDVVLISMFPLLCLIYG